MRIGHTIKHFKVWYNLFMTTSGFLYANIGFAHTQYIALLLPKISSSSSTLIKPYQVSFNFSFSQYHFDEVNMDLSGSFFIPFSLK